MTFSLKTTTAARILKEERRRDPNNYLILYLQHYNDAIRLIITDDESLYEPFRENHEKRREIMDEAPEGTPYYHWLEAEMLFQLGLAQIKYGTKISGASKVYSSYKLIRENEKLYPRFLEDDRLVATFDMAFANIPPVLRWAAWMIGISGDMERGFEKMESYHREALRHPGLADESIFYMILAYKIRWEEDEGWRFIQSLDEEYYNITLTGFFYANLAMFSGRNDDALQILMNLRERSPEIPFYAMDYIQGRCYLNKLDPGAGACLERFIGEAPVQDYKKDACNRLSWHYLLNGDTERYEHYRSKVATIGADLRDRDREAIAESRTGYRPNVRLLKARLLFDGGYNEPAWDQVNGVEREELDFLPYALEYHYRRGRLFYRSDELPESIAEMEWVIRHGSDQPYTFATRAALHLGQVYEEQGETEKAAEYYALCIDLYDSGHSAEGIANKAEMALKTLDARR